MRILLKKLTAIGALAFLAACALPFAEAMAAEQVPFVGCAGDGQTGPVAAPAGAPKTVAIDAAAARQLAFYQAKDSFGVLAPRGWKCFYFYGSSGATLIVAPSGNLQSAMDAPLSGSAVVATLDIGGTSGRFQVAKYSARLFAKVERAFIAGVIAEGIEPQANFPAGPYPADKTTYKNARLVEFETPADRDGLGTSDRLQKNSLPITGMAKLEDSPDGPNFFLLTVRLPANQAILAPAIVSQAE
ncbi:MAG: hypothetical protein ABR878_04520 [Roseiarcus sp.]|jgi:hypothetical protein